MNISFIKIADCYFGIPLCFIIGLFLRMKEKIRPINFARPVKNILLIKTWGLGNIVLMLPSIKAIKAYFPQLKISFLSLKGNREILEENPLIDTYYLLDLDRKTSFLKSSLQLIYSLRRQKFDLVIDFDQFARYSALISLLIGVPRRIGFDTKGQGKIWAFNQAVTYNNHQHTVCAFADLVRKMGIKELDLNPVPIHVTDKDKIAVDAFLNANLAGSNPLLVGMHLGSGENFPQRRWPVDNYVELANRLMRQLPVKIILTGCNRQERILNNYFCSKIKDNILNIHGKFNVREIAYLISKCRLFFSADTAPLHIASAMGVPVVSFFGPNTPLLYGPRGKNDLVFYHPIECSPCLTNFNAKTSGCRNPVCITSIAVDEVWQKIKKYFADA